MVTDTLGHLGCEIISALGGTKGIGVALRERPDLIVLDQHMPEASGWDVLEALREKGGEWHPPVIFFTGVGLAAQDCQRLVGQVQAVVLKGSNKAHHLREIGRLTRMALK